MNKKFYLGAILLGAMTLSTGALTSCIDNDEPEGITNLRGAKAELLRAKAALELAKAETEKQNANLVAAKAAVEQANAKIAEAIAKQEEAKAKQEEAKVAYEQAKSDKAKAEALEALAAAEIAQAEAEAALAEIKAQSELNLQNIKNDLLAAQNRYDQLVAEIEAAKAVLTGEQAQKLASLQDAVDAAWTAYTDQQGVVLGKMQELFDATNGEIDQEETLRDALADAESHLAAVTAVYDELKALSENVAPTAWEARMDSLKAYGDGTTGTSALEIAELNLKLTEIKQSEAYKTAEKEDDDARRAYVTAQQLYNYLADENERDCFDAGSAHAGSWDEQSQWGYYEDGTHPTAQPYTGPKKYDLDGAKIAITNPAVYEKLYNQLNGTSYAGSLISDWQGMRLQVDGSYVVYGDGEKYSKLKRTYEAVTALLEETGSEVEHLDSISTALDIALSEEDLVEIKEELMEYGYIKKRHPGGKKPKITSRPFHYISSDGYHMYVGKNNFQNEELTFKFATGNDWWFHAKGVPGSHVIVKTDGAEDMPDATFEEAGRLAAYYSQNRGNEKVEIDYIQKKHIKKPKGGKPGFVVYYTNYSLMIDSDISKIKQI